MAKAFHIAQFYDLENDTLVPYAHVVANPRAAWTSWVRRQGQRIYSSFDTLTLTGVGVGDGWWDAMRDALFPYATSIQASERQTADFYWDFTNTDGAIAYADWIHDHVKATDGIYLDNFFASPPFHVLADFPAAQRDVVRKNLPLWRSALLARIAALGGNTRVIMGNTAGSTHPWLNGISIEGEHWPRLGGILGILARFAIQWTRGRKPKCNVDWNNTLELGDMIAKGYIRRETPT